MCSSDTDCVLCDEGYYLNAGICTYCVSVLSGCINCDNSTYCSECSEGFYEASNGSCDYCTNTI